MKGSLKIIENIVRKASVSIISSVDDEGYPNTKAMLPPRKQVGLKELYFTTNTSSMRVDQYKNNQKACVYFFDKRFYQGIMLKGTMKVLTDSKSKKMIWKDGDEMYYSKGITDPDYCVLKFTARSGRYYSHFKSVTFKIAG